MGVLDDYMAEARRAPFGFDGLPSLDCCTFAAGAALALTGRDPAAPYRGRYSTEAEARRFFAEGGVPRLLDGAFRAVGFSRTSDVVDGDCACLRVLDDGVQVIGGAVRWRRAWWMKAPIGLAWFDPATVRVLVAWRIA